MSHKLKFIFNILFLFSLLFFLSCRSTISKMVLPELNDGKYDSEFPYKNASKELEEITKTIKMIHGMAFYKSYTFQKETRLIKNDSRFKELKNYADYKTTFHETYSGTATVIYKEGTTAAFLTCAHILDFPDTLIFYYYDSIGQKTKYINGVAIKTKQINYLPEISGKNELKVLAFDKALDLAVLSGKFNIKETIQIKKFNYPFGHSKNLRWGSFVYLFGYPLNHKMVTKGIVSPPKFNNSKIFFVDANINKGFSGGIVLAIKDGIPNFELVGIVRSGPGKTDYYLKPEKGKNYPLINSKIPFSDKIYVDKNLNLRYGIANVITIESVREFLKKNKTVFLKNNLNIKNFFNY